MFTELGGKVAWHHTIDEIEQMKTGANKIFPTKENGWLEFMRADI